MKRWLLLFVVVAATVAMVFVPVWLIRPFSPQTGRGLEVAYWLRRWSPVATVIAAGICVALTLWLWRGRRLWLRRVALVVMLVPVFAAAWFARQNHFEWMFKPLAESAYAKTDDAAFVAGDDMVMAVENNGEAAAYPVRQMAYHHLVHDRVGGVPIVATY